MSAPTFEVKILTPERAVFADKATHLLAPGAMGYLGILAHHAPLTIRFRFDERRFDVDGASVYGLEFGANFRSFYLQGEHFWFDVERRASAGLPDPNFAGYYLHNSDIQPAVDAGIPVVLLGHRAARPGVDAVTVDDFGGAQVAARYLTERGHRRIGFIRGPAGPGPITERVDGYHAALDEAGIKADPAWVVHTAFGRQGGADGVTEPRPPQAQRLS